MPQAGNSREKLYVAEIMSVFVVKIIILPIFTQNEKVYINVRNLNE